MKPIRLTMSAFGSYSGVEQVDFEKIKDGLFLITGDTGAGKTTIFDGISYALYGQSSGERRDGEMMRSQYAPDEQKTYVEFIFSEAGQRYQIRRSPAYERRSRRKNKAGNYAMTRESAEVELILADGRVFPGKMKETDQKIAEIIGMDSDQFRQVSMISQGDFMKLLLASSKERKEIFSRLFPTEIYLRIQKRLAEREKQLYDRLEDLRKACEREIENVQCPKESGYREIWSEKGRFSEIDHRELMECLKGMNQESQVQEKVLQAEISKVTAILSRIEKLEDKTKEWSEAEKHVTGLEQQILEDTRAEAKGEQRLLEAETEYKAEAPELQREAVLLQTAMAEYDRMEAAHEMLAQAEAEWKRWERAVKRSEEILDALKQRQTKLEREQSGFEDVESRRFQAENQKEESWEKLEGLEDLLKSQKELEDLQKQVEGGQKILTETLETYARLSRQYDEIYEKFIRCQAGLLARDLKPETPCPVCGSCHHPAPSSLGDESISQAAVEAAKRTRETQEEEVTRAKDRLYELKERRSGFQSRLIQAAAQWMENPKIAYETGTFWQQAKQQRETAEKIYKEQTEIWKDLEKLARIFKENQVILKQIDSQMEVQTKELEVQRERRAEWRTKAENQRHNCEEMKRKLRFDSKEEAVSREKQVRLCLEVLEKKQVDARKYAEQVREKLQLARGELKASREKAKRLANELKTAEQEMKSIGQKALLTEQKDQWIQAEKVLFGQRQQNEHIFERLTKHMEVYDRLRKDYGLLHHLNEVANGKKAGKARIDFQTYMQRRYFEQMVSAANQRLMSMSDHQFLLECRSMENLGKQGEVGLDLDVYSLVNDRVRDVRTLSGGESFMAALALALGMADVIQRQAGKIHVDTLFIDEGFGSLDDRARNQAVKVLGELAGTDRLVGIISHVSELKEQIETQIIVKKDNRGSHILMDVSM